jgi:hypothetical protein
LGSPIRLRRETKFLSSQLLLLLPPAHEPINIRTFVCRNSDFVGGTGRSFGGHDERVGGIGLPALPDMAFPQMTPMKQVPGAFLNTPAMASRFQPAQDNVHRQLWPVGDSTSGDLQGRSDPVTTAPVDRDQINQSQIAPTSQASHPGFGSTSLVSATHTANLPPIVSAAKAINTFLQQDETFPSLESYCRRECQHYKA